jgi:TPR repeat protein
MYANGQGVNPDYNEAIKWYRKAAEQGNAPAQFNLGVNYENGQGVNQDYNEAVKWYRKAAEQGNATAQSNLGVMYENGEGVEKDDDVAVDWYTKSAKAGYANAIAVLKRKSNSNQLFLADKRLNMPYKAFISYRRSGGREYARVLYLELRYRGIKTFFDYTSLQHGDFSADILRAIEEAPNFIMVVTDGAFDRCVDENDWVRKEIEYAKKLGKNIVPIAPTGHQQDLSALPDNLADVRRRQVFRLDMENLFEESVGKIVKECLQDI